MGPIEKARRALLPPNTVREVTGLSDTTIWRLRKAGKFPEPVQVSPHRKCWVADEVFDWIDARIAEREKADA